jgi:PAS domain S-box-containing protein
LLPTTPAWFASSVHDDGGLVMANPVKILLVDDHEDNLLALEAALQPLGQNLVKARSGEEASRLLLKDDFAVVLLDLRLGDMDGFEVARRIRAQGKPKHIPIIFITASDNDELTLTKASMLGAMDFLVKPLVPDILRAKVAVFIDLFQNTHLRENERRLRTLLENAWDGVSLIAPDGTVLENIPDNLHRLGYSVEEFVGHSALDFIHPDDLPAVREAMILLLQAPGSKVTRQYRLRCKDGSWRWVEGTGTNLLQDAAVRALVVNYRDITEQKEAERVRAELVAIVESSEDAIIGEDLFGIITSWNKGAERLFGYAAGEVIGKPLSLLIPAEHPDELPGLLERLRRGERIEHYRTERVHKDGSRVDVSLSISPIKNGEGEVIGAAKIARDIGPQKRLEEELRHRADELAEANRQKDQFLAMLAHELRNPLAPLRTGLHILRQPQTTTEVRRQTHDIMERQLHHLGRLVDDLLDVSRVLRGKVQLHKERLDLGQLGRTAVEDRRSLLQQSGLALRLHVPETPVWVMGDPTRLTQILNNLLDNAVKFADGGREVTVSVEADGEHRQAVLSVRDEGIGIEPEILPQLFTPFLQGDRSLDRSRGGLGLGLAMVKGLAELHGGIVEASSEGVGHGAEFFVRLPLEREPSALSEMPTAPSSTGRHLRILVVEDNRDGADSLRLLLELLGHEVRVAYSGPEGVAAAGDWRPDVVLCDIGLPGLDGYGVARELRLNPTTARVRLLALTGYGQDEDFRRSREAGFDHHLIKPADPAELSKLLSSG